MKPTYILGLLFAGAAIAAGPIRNVEESTRAGKDSDIFQIVSPCAVSSIENIWGFRRFPLRGKRLLI